MTIRVALTFDAEHPDRPTRPGVAEEILDLLAAERVPATFFVQGRWAEAYPATAARIAKDGHLVGNHSHYHARMPLLSDHGLRSDVQFAEDVIRQTTGVDPRPWFRCPFGAGGDDPALAGALRALGYDGSVGWNVEAADWEATTEQVRSRVVAGTRRHGDGAVVLLHTWPIATLQALPAIVSELRADGTELVRMDAFARARDGTPTT
jgi:peptidoglycan/xylan/chitin deacetylase (PgdA/CDA1 family)